MLPNRSTVCFKNTCGTAKLKGCIVRPGPASVVARGRSAKWHGECHAYHSETDSLGSRSMESLQRRHKLQVVSQRMQPTHQQPEQEAEFLWAGYSALEEQVEKGRQRHDALVTQVQELQAKLHAVQQQPPGSAWQAASFLLFFLFFINFWGMLANLQMAWGWPWAVAKTSASSLWLKQMLGLAVPFTNTVVVMIFCVQAVRAAWTCLKW